MIMVALGSFQTVDNRCYVGISFDTTMCINALLSSLVTKGVIF